MAETRRRAKVGHSVVDLDGVRLLFCAAIPQRGETAQEQTIDALHMIDSVVRAHGSGGSIVSQTVFYRDDAQLEVVRRLMREFYGHELPVTTFVHQHPCGGRHVAIEALGMWDGDDQVEFERWSEQLVIARHGRKRWAHFGQIVPRTAETDVYGRALNSFEQIESLLAGADIRFDQIIRTWIYSGDITGTQGSCQRYQELNRARTDFFAGREFCARLLPPDHASAVYPASTGIGTDDRDIVLSGIALESDCQDTIVVPLENPRQTAAFEYARQYSPTSPKFSRAMGLVGGRSAIIFISGTASITNSETRHVGDVEAQTHETLDNIEALISNENFAASRLRGFDAARDGLTHIRVYLKHARDYRRVRAICRKRWGQVPAIYAVADVCRTDLLVEIEGIACATNDPTP